jgi:hypothetical protein
MRGNIYNRELQYAMADQPTKHGAEWRGTRLKNGNQYYMIGSVQFDRQAGQWTYGETLYANGRLDMKSQAFCGEVAPDAFEPAPQAQAAPQPPIMNYEPPAFSAPPIIDWVPLYPTEGGKRHKLDVLIGGAPLRMLYDTGATVGLINSEIARKIEANNLGTWGPMMTITTANNGMMKLPSIYVREIRIGSHRVKNVQFAVGDTENMIIAGPVLNSIGTVTIDANGGKLVFNQ